MTDLRIGTSAFTAAGWEQAFYPAGMKPADYLSYYATKFNTVEVDSTFYRAPSVATVNGWERKMPTGFILAAKDHRSEPDDKPSDRNPQPAAKDRQPRRQANLLLSRYQSNLYKRKGPRRSIAGDLSFLTPNFNR